MKYILVKKKTKHLAQIFLYHFQFSVQEMGNPNLKLL